MHRCVRCPDRFAHRDEKSQDSASVIELATNQTGNTTDLWLRCGSQGWKTICVANESRWTKQIWKSEGSHSIWHFAAESNEHPMSTNPRWTEEIGADQRHRMKLLNDFFLVNVDETSLRRVCNKKHLIEQNERATVDTGCIEFVSIVSTSSIKHVKINTNDRDQNGTRHLDLIFNWIEKKTEIVLWLGLKSHAKVRMIVYIDIEPWENQPRPYVSFHWLRMETKVMNFFFFFFIDLETQFVVILHMFESQIG